MPVAYMVLRGLLQVKKKEYKNGMDIKSLEEKLEKLRQQLILLETEEVEKIRLKRIAADMGDDYRENEGAKLVMEQHEMLHMRTGKLRGEIALLKKKLISLGRKVG
jgi:hypothetical protein